MLDVWSLVIEAYPKKIRELEKKSFIFWARVMVQSIFQFQKFYICNIVLRFLLQNLGFFQIHLLIFIFFAVKPYHVNIHWNWAITTWNNIFFSKNHQNHNVYALWETKTLNFVKSNLFKHDMDMETIYLIQYETHEIIVFFVRIIKHELFTVFGNVFLICHSI